MKTFNTTIIALAIAAAAATSAFASNNGLNAADPQFVNTHALSDSYSASGAASQATEVGRSTYQLAPVTDAENVNIIHQLERRGN
jgi:hypothetical protein